MGTMIRLANSIVNNNELEIVPVPYTGVAGAKVATQPRMNLPQCRDISGSKTGISQFGLPVRFESNYVRGGSNRLKVEYAPKINGSRTMCVVARLAPESSGAAFFIGDAGNSRGCVLFANKSAGWRAQVNVDDGAGGVRGAFPTVLPNLPQMNVNDWHFAVLTVDAVAKVATFHLPALSYSTSVEWTTFIPQGAGNLWIAGDAGAAANSSDVAYATYHDKALSALEIKQQYASAKTYCEAVKIDLK